VCSSEQPSEVGWDFGEFSYHPEDPDQAWLKLEAKHAEEGLRLTGEQVVFIESGASCGEQPAWGVALSGHLLRRSTDAHHQASGGGSCCVA
jgi:hypothetical protein